MAKYVSPEGLDDALKAVATTIGSLSTRISSNAQGLQTLSSEMPTKVSQLQNDSGYTTNKGTVTGVKINGTTKSPSSGVVDLGTVITAHQDISGKVDKVDGKGLSTNDFTTTLKNKLNGVASGAEVNQNAFSNIAIGDTMLAADSKTDLLTIAAGDNITLTPDTSATKVTISASVPTLSSLMGSSAIGGTSSYIYWNGSKWATKSLGTLAFSSATSFPASDVYSWAKASTKPSYTKSEVGLGNVTNDAQVKRSEMGVASGVATLDASGLVPTSQLPSYVDDVLEYTAKSNFPTTGATGKIYVDTSTNKTYRWGGSAYVEISASLALGTTSSTAYRGDLGAQNATNISTLQSSVSTLQGYFDSTAAKVAKQTLYGLTVGSKTFNGSSAITITKSDLGLGNVENKSSATIRSEITKANVTSALGTGTGTTKYLREDGSWATPPDTNTNTTYSFSGGTNQFTVTPSNGSALTVTITPSISNNVTYSGTLTSGQVAVLDGTSGKIKASGYTIAKSVPSDAKFTDTTYSYVAPKQDGSEYGLTASGEKYEWNNKQNAISDLSTIRSNATNGATAYSWGNHANAGYQKASTAINTGNIGVQIVASAKSADSLSKYSGGFTVPSTGGWYKLAVYKSPDPRGSVRLALVTVGGSYIPRYTEVKFSEGWSSIVINQNGKFDWISKYRYTTDGNWCYIEAYFTTSCDIVLHKLQGTGYVDDVGTNWSLYTTATQGSGTEIGTFDASTNSTLYSSGTIASPGGFNKVGYDDTYVLLAGGGGKLISALNVNYANSAGAVAWSGVTGKPSFATVATSGSYNDLSNKPTIPTSSTVSGWGFTKNTGTITQIKVNDTSIATSGVANIPIATSTADGAMSYDMYRKLDTAYNNRITGGSQTSTSSSDGGSNVFTFTNADGTTSTFTVKNGSKGSAGTNGTTPTIKAANGSNIGSVGTPSVTASTSGTTTTFTFNYLKGAKGDKGDKGDPGTNATTTSVATTSANGLMSSTHVSKLSSVESAVSTLSSEKLDKPSTWVNPSLTLSGATSVSTNPVRYRLCGNLLTIQGAFTYTYGSASDGTLKLFTLPSGYRSSYSHSSWQYATGNWMWRLYIDANGVVYIHSIVHPKNNTTTNSSSMTFLITVSYYLD